MATETVSPPPSVKKRNFHLRDFFKLCRSIARVFPKASHHIDKDKHERKLQTESKRHENNQFHVSGDLSSFKEANQVEKGVSLCKVRSYRFDTDVKVNKKTLSYLSRSCSHNTSTAAAKNPMMRSLSFMGRSRSSSNRMTDSGSMPTLKRSTSTTPKNLTNQILYSSSSAKVAKPRPTEEKLACTLEELCNGCTKKIKIKRDVITSSGKMSEEEETVEIKVKPGWKGGTKVTFEGKGEEAMGSVPADLTFEIVEEEHEVFKREGDDLEMEVEVSLLEALTGFELSVALLDGDKMDLKIKDVIHSGYVTVIPGKGMPISKENGKRRGDLRVRFRTKFPQKLTSEQRAEIQNILQDSF